MACRPISALLVCAAMLAGAGWPAAAPAEGAGAYVGRAEGGQKSRSRLKNRASHLEARRKHIRARLRTGGRGEDASDAAPPIVVIERPPAPRPEPAAELAPPDPAAPFAHLRARGHAGAAPLAPGDALPEGLPYVTLNWRTYDLPRPPAGEVYARIGRAVYRIEPEAGRVTARIAPGAAGGG